MCLAVPTQIQSREGDFATVNMAGIRRRISLKLVPEAHVGDYVLVHVGYAINLVDPEEAKRTLEMAAPLDPNYGETG